MRPLVPGGVERDEVIARERLFPVGQNHAAAIIRLWTCGRRRDKDQAMAGAARQQPIRRHQQSTGIQGEPPIPIRIVEHEQPRDAQAARDDDAARRLIKLRAQMQLPHQVGQLLRCGVRVARQRPMGHR